MRVEKTREVLWNEEEAAAGEGRKEMKGRIGLERASRAEGRQNDRKADNASVFCMAAKGKKKGWQVSEIGRRWKYLWSCRA